MKIKVKQAAKRFIDKIFDFGEVSKTATSRNPDKSISCQMYFFKNTLSMDSKQYNVIVTYRPWCEKWQVKLEPIDSTGARTITLDDIEVLYDKIILNRITDPKLSLLENMFEYADSHDGRVEDYKFNQMCEELGLNPDDEVMTVYNSTDRKWDRYVSGFWTML